ncbi:serine/threonine protein kinase [Candidatus Uabimicrobium amorphum]|uniref:Serine/threonine protein kinase n=1 Tax=Uabimicrobium amorphum TaxID=2596890 RepID=A0A5S9ITS9_UABAM|nr:serine/threonine-protein kinase [Candidatus Uabimicrobium amorphum]BBM88018.1 serine/threonine protein kinase [Candidatus Uabimicrobium amorphum]
MKEKALYGVQSVRKDDHCSEKSPKSRRTPKKIILNAAKLFTKNKNIARAQREKKPDQKNVIKLKTYRNDIDTLRIVGKEIDDRYLIERAIGHGGMGVIYLANHKRLEKKYAIKFLYDKNQESSISDELEQRFVMEARIATEIRHNNLVEVYDVSSYKKYLYMVMEYIDGETVEQAVIQGKIFTEQDVIRIMKELLSALEVMHEKGYVHRDIKPSNIMVNQNGVAKLVDLGIAKDLSSTENLTQPYIIIGTLEFMSPEQIADGDVGFASDLYSLGATAYYMLTGENYVEGSNMQKMDAICLGDFSIDLPHVSEEFMEVLRRMMTTCKKRRFQRAKDVIEVLNLIENVRKTQSIQKDRFKMK